MTQYISINWSWSKDFGLLYHALWGETWPKLKIADADKIEDISAINWEYRLQSRCWFVSSVAIIASATRFPYLWMQSHFKIQEIIKRKPELLKGRDGSNSNSVGLFVVLFVQNGIILRSIGHACLFEALGIGETTTSICSHLYFILVKAAKVTTWCSKCYSIWLTCTKVCYSAFDSLHHALAW